MVVRSTVQALRESNGWFSWLAALLLAVATVLAIQDALRSTSYRNTGPSIFEEYSSAVVYVSHFDADGERVSHGSGAFIGPNLVITAAHVSEALGGAAVIDHETEGRHNAHVIFEDPENDLAVYRTALSSDIWVEPFCDDPPLGAPVYTIGNPSGVGTRVITSGFFIGDDPIEDAGTLIPFQLPILPGSSGGPIITSDGYIISVVSQFSLWRHPYTMGAGSWTPFTWGPPPSALCDAVRSAQALQSLPTRTPY